jgi:hypothetical protein
VVADCLEMFMVRSSPHTTKAYRQDFTAIAGRDSLIWPREGGLKWPRLRAWRGVVVTV